MEVSKVGESPSRDIVLDSWRGISILFVLLHHAVYFRYGSIFRGFLEVPLATGATLFASSVWWLDYVVVEFSERAGPLGVKIFFVISGFIITSLLLTEEAKNGRISLRAFYFRRVVRILPPLVAYAFSVLCFSLMGWVAYDIVGFFASLGFVCNTELVSCGQTYIHTWTLSVEEQFYILWPLLFLVISARRRVPFLVAVYLVLISLSATGVLVSYGWINNPLSHACIALGALYAVSPWWKNYINRWGILTSGVAALCTIVLASVGFEETARQLYWSATPFVIMSAIAVTYRVKEYLPHLLFAGLAEIGVLSYSLYLWQEIFLMEPYHYLTASPLLAPVFLIPCALISFYWIERPVIAWGKRALRVQASSQ